MKRKITYISAWGTEFKAPEEAIEHEASIPGILAAFEADLARIESDSKTVGGIPVSEELKEFLREAIENYRKLWAEVQADRNADKAATPKRITLRIKLNPNLGYGHFKDEHGRQCFAASLSHIVSMANNGEGAPYMPKPGDTYYWSIDQYGNDFWVEFYPEDNLQFTLSCRYGGEQAETLAALANYVARRCNCEVLKSDAESETAPSNCGLVDEPLSLQKGVRIKPGKVKYSYIEERIRARDASK